MENIDGQKFMAYTSKGFSQTTDDIDYARF